MNTMSYRIDQLAYSANTNFKETYENICSLKNAMPLQFVINSLSSESGSCLILNADKIKSSDWEAIYSAIKVNTNLKNINITSNYIEELEINGKSKPKKPPSIRNKEIRNKICRSIRECLSISHNLSKLEICNVPLTIKDSAQIAKGLRANKSLKILSLDRCLIGDEGLAIICRDIQSSSNLNRVNFSSCNLTHEGANILASLIKVQALKRHNEAWKDSLRYGRPDLDSMFGIRRITINSNPLIGDAGVQSLADAFKSDLWLKALDLQNCGITTVGANYLLDGLKFNAMMHVLDVRLNVDIDRDTLQKIMEQVMINSSGNNTDYEWMDLTQTAVMSSSLQGQPGLNNNINPNKQVQIAKQDQQQLGDNQTSGKKLKKRRNTNASFSKKSQFNAALTSLKMKRCKSTGSVLCNKSLDSSTSAQPASQYHHQLQYTKPANSQPWRAAPRAGRYRVTTQRKITNQFEIYETNEFYDEDEENEDMEENDLSETYNDNRTGMLCSNGKNRSFDNTNFTLNENQSECNYQQKQLKNHLLMASSTFDYEKFTYQPNDENDTTSINTNSNTNITYQNEHNTNGSRNLVKQPSMRRLEPPNGNSSKNDIHSGDKSKNSVKDLLILLKKEQESKACLEDFLLQLEDENSRLKAQVNALKAKVDQQQVLLNQRQENSNMNRTLLEDDKALEIIELTLHKYQNFLDFLRNAGFGKLIDIGEMNQQQSELQMSAKKPPNNKSIEKSSSFKSLSSSINISPNTAQQKYYLSKANKIRNYAESNDISECLDGSSYNFDCDSTMNNIDTLLSNALEISRSYRRLNSSTINNTTALLSNQKYSYKKLAHEGSNKENADETDYFDFKEMHLNMPQNSIKSKSNLKKKSENSSNSSENLKNIINLCESRNSNNDLS